MCDQNLLREIDAYLENIVPGICRLRTLINSGAGFPKPVVDMTYDRDELLALRARIRRAINSPPLTAPR